MHLSINFPHWRFAQNLFPSNFFAFYSQKLIQSLVRVKGGIRVARFIARLLNDAFFKGKWAAIDGQGVKYRLDIISELEWQILCYGGFDLPLLAVLKRHLRLGDTFIDIGANVGCISLPLVSHLGVDGHVLAFEADPEIFQKLQTNASSNSFIQLSGFNHAIGSTTGSVVFHRATNSSSFGQAVGSLYASDWHSGGSTFQVNVDSLDRVLDKHPVKRVHAIKIDVEGAEMDVLRGSLLTIERNLPLFVIEVCKHTYISAGWTPQDLFDLLSPFGYSFEALDEKNPGQTRPLPGIIDVDYLTIVARVF